MDLLKSKHSNSSIQVGYDDFNNTVEIHIGNDTGFRFVNLTFEQCDLLIDLINEHKNQIL